ncbi:MAG: ABC transporter ATP-binding protein [Burkholderiales bacterium]|nr:ABC transporter ATP-binding protein [Burkholderiales bacterium]
MSGRPLLEVKNLRVEIPTRRTTLVALDDVSFTIGKGEVLGVVGESGAGKSMTGNAVIGLLDPPAHIVSGEIWLNGQRIDNMTEAQREKLRGKEIGAIFQDPLTSLNPLFTVGDQLVETIMRHSKRSEKEALSYAIELLKQTGIPAAEQRIKDYPHQFSGGMRQRVVIALVLASDPKLIIADEPTTALDVSIQAQIIDLLKTLCRERGTSIMLISHDMGVIAEVADRIAIMYAGRVAEIGNVRDVIDDPKHPYTVGLMGAIPKLTDSSSMLTQIPGQMPRLNEVPVGCAFHPRCPLSDDICVKQKPPFIQHGNSFAACWKSHQCEDGEIKYKAEPFHVRDPEELEEMAKPNG